MNRITVFFDSCLLLTNYLIDTEFRIEIKNVSTICPAQGHDYKEDMGVVQDFFFCSGHEI